MHHTGFKNPQEVVKILMQIQEFRKARMGNEMAEALFGDRVKSPEYNIKKNSIIKYVWAGKRRGFKGLKSGYINK